MDPEYVKIGHILRPRGNKGEVRVRSEADSPEAMIPLLDKRIFIRRKGDDEPRLARVENKWIHKGCVVIKFEGTPDIASAELLRDASVLISIEDRDPLHEDEYYLDQLIGLEVWSDEHGTQLGLVKDVITVAGNPLLELRRHEGNNCFIPFVRSMVRSVDLGKKRIRVSLPDGLVDL